MEKASVSRSSVSSNLQRRENQGCNGAKNVLVSATKADTPLLCLLALRSLHQRAWLIPPAVSKESIDLERLTCRSRNLFLRLFWGACAKFDFAADLVAQRARHPPYLLILG